MTFAKGILAALALAAAVGQASATELEHWPAPAARQLNALIEANANKGAYAVFDMDNTSFLLASPVEGNRTVVEHAPETQLLESKNG